MCCAFVGLGNKLKQRFPSFHRGDVVSTGILYRQTTLRATEFFKLTPNKLTLCGTGLHFIPTGLTLKFLHSANRVHFCDSCSSQNNSPLFLYTALDLNYFGSMVTNDARCIREIKSRIAMAKAAFNKKKTLFISKMHLKCKEETSKVLHLENSFVRCRNLVTFRKVDQKFLKISKCGVGEE